MIGNIQRLVDLKRLPVLKDLDPQPSRIGAQRAGVKGGGATLNNHGQTPGWIDIIANQLVADGLPVALPVDLVDTNIVEMNAQVTVVIDVAGMNFQRPVKRDVATVAGRDGESMPEAESTRVKIAPRRRARLRLRRV